MTQKKPKKPTSAELREANDSQVQSYFRSYDRFWRLHKLVMLKRLLRDRESIKEEFKEHYGSKWTNDFEQIIYRNVTDGILADAMSEVVMLCEDYFCFLQYIREPELFVKSAISYSAGKVTKLKRDVETPDKAMLRRMFFVPTEKLVETSLSRSNVGTANSELKSIDELLDEVAADHRSIVLFHKNHTYVHGQYKHGLKLALHEQNGPMQKKELDRRKTEFSAPIWYFENREQMTAFDRGGLVVPDISSEALRKHLAYLALTRNMLRLSLTWPIDIDYLIGTARHTVGLISALINNRLSFIENAKSHQLVFELPLPGAALQAKKYTFVLFRDQKKPTIDDYKLPS